MNNDIQMHPLIPVCNHLRVMKKFMTYDEINSYKNYWNTRLISTENDNLLKIYAKNLL